MAQDWFRWSDGGSDAGSRFPVPMGIVGPGASHAAFMGPVIPWLPTGKPCAGSAQGRLCGIFGSRQGVDDLPCPSRRAHRREHFSTGDGVPMGGRVRRVGGSCSRARVLRVDE